MKVSLVFVITGLGTGGAETMLLKLLEQLDRGRFEAHVISLTTLGDIGPRIQALGIGVEALGMHPLQPSPWRFMWLVRRLKALQPDVVQTWMYHADLIGGLAARWAGVRRVVWGIRNTNLDPDKTKWTTRAVVRLCSRLSGHLPMKIVSCSDVAARVHGQRGYDAGKMLVIPNGFDLSRFVPDARCRPQVRAELGLAPGVPLVGMVARCDPMKNHMGFIQAAAAVRQQLPAAHFVMIGGGVDVGNASLSAAISAADLGGAVHLLGLRHDIPRLMAALDVLALPSHGEAFPNVLGEAMACGVPCVTTDVGDAAYIVGTSGHVVPVGDMAALADKIVQLLRLGPALLEQRRIDARVRIGELFDIRRVVRQYEDLYAALALG